MSCPRTNPGKRSDFYIALAVFLLALLLRLTWAVLAESVDPFLVSDPLLGDAASYHRLAMNLLAGEGYSQHPPTPSSFWPPLYPYTLAGIFALLGPELVGVRVVQAVWGAVPAVVFAWIALKIYGQRESILVGIGLALYPYLIYFGTWLIAEALFMLLLSGAFFCAFQFYRHPGHGWLIGMGVLSGLSILTKPSALFYMPFIALWVILVHPGNLMKRSGNVITLAITTLLVVTPWSVRNYLAFGQFELVSSNAGYTFLGANNPNAWGGHDEFYPPLIPGMSEVEMEDVFFAEAWQWIRTHPADFLKLGLVKLQRLFSPLSVASQPQDYPIPGASIVYLIYGCFLLCALAGMVLGLKQARAIGYLYAPVIGVMLSTFLYYGDVRYTLPVAPSLVVFSALAVVQGAAWVRRRSLMSLRLAW